MRTVLVLSGGPGAVPEGVSSSVGDLAFVVAADGGLHLADELGVAVDVVVGDMDSVDAARLSGAESAGATVVRYPTDKDATDLELALAVAVAAAPERIVVVGSASGRLDHLLGTVAVLASDRWAGVVVDAWLGAAQVHVVRGRRSFAGRQGETVSLLAHGGPAVGVTTTGLRWGTAGGVLDPGSALGVSNEMLGTVVEVDVADGCVVVVRPGPDGTTGHDEEAGR